MQDTLYHLPVVLDMQASAALHKHLLEQAAQGRGVVLDAQDVERIATPGVQCLLSAARTCRAAGMPFTVLQPSPALLSVLRDLALEGALEGIPENGV